MKRYIYEILSGFTGTTTFQVPIFLEASVDEMGIMSGFDGEIEQVEQFANFTYQSKPGVTLASPTPLPSETPLPPNPSVTPSISVSAVPVTPSVTPSISVSPTPSITPTECP